VIRPETLRTQSENHLAHRRTLPCLAYHTAAIILWVLTAGAAAYFFSAGYTVTASDGRQAVVVSTGERNQVLEEMRAMLAATQAIAEAPVDGDSAAVAAGGTPIGIAAVNSNCPGLLAKLPFEMRQIGLWVHQGSTNWPRRQTPVHRRKS
jgi:hypothetical protein